MSYSGRLTFENEKQVDALFVLIATAACLAVLLFKIENNAYWLDEFISLSFTQEPMGVLLGEHWSIDTHRPYYYVLQKIWNAVFGADPFAVRFLNALLGALCVPFLFVIAKKLGGREVAWFSVLCLILSPLFVYQSREARMYPLLNLSVLAAVAAFIYALDAYRLPPQARQARPRSTTFALWAGFVLAAASAFYAQATGILLMVLCGAFLLLAVLARVLSPVAVRDFALAGIAYAIIVIPAVQPMIFHVRTTLSHFWIPEPSFGWVYSQLLGAYPYPFWAKPIIMIGFVLGLWAAFRNRFAFLLLLVLIAAQPLLMWLLSYYKPVLIVRAIVWPTLFASILLGFAIAALRQRQYQIPAVAAVMALQALTIWPQFHTTRQLTDIDRLANHFARFDPKAERLILGLQDFEYNLRWNHPELITGDVLALNYGDERASFHDLNRSTLIARTDAEKVPMDTKRFWILSEIKPVFPIPPEKDVAGALAAIAAKGTLVERVDVGSVRLDIYETKNIASKE